MSSAWSGILRAGRRAGGGLSSPPLSSHQHLQQQLRHKHQVRVILTRDLPEGQMRGVYAGEVHNVAAGYARNYLIPKKLAVYATPRNFERCGLVDPDIAAKEEAALQKLAGEEESEELKAADLLRRYLRNKHVKIIRNVDPNIPNMCHPGHVDAKNLRDKLSKQLKIDLDDPPHETIHIRNETVVGLDELEDHEMMQFLKEMDEEDVPVKTEATSDGDDAVETKEVSDGDESEDSKEVAATTQDEGELKDCDTKVKQIGDYLAKITLRGGYVVPLKFRVLRRQGGMSHHGNN